MSPAPRRRATPDGGRSRSAGGGLVLVMAAATTWGTTGATMALLGRRSPLGPMAVGSLRLAVAAPILLALAGATGAFREARLRPHLPRLALMGAAQAAFQVGYFGAVPYVGVAATALVAICTSPLLIAALAVGLLGERLTAPVAAAMALGVGGTALLVGGRFGLSGISFASMATGTALALGAAFAYAFYVVLAKGLTASLPPVAIAGISFAIAAIFLSPATVGAQNLWETVRPVWPHLAYLAIVPTVLAYALYIRGLQTTSATAAGVGSLFEPLTATVLGIAVFREPLGAQGLVGAALLLGAVAFLFLGNRARP